MAAHNAEELSERLKDFFNAEEGPVLLEVFTNPEEDAQAMEDYYKAFS